MLTININNRIKITESIQPKLNPIKLYKMKSN